MLRTDHVPRAGREGSDICFSCRGNVIGRRTDLGFGYLTSLPPVDTRTGNQTGCRRMLEQGWTTLLACQTMIENYLNIMARCVRGEPGEGCPGTWSSSV